MFRRFLATAVKEKNVPTSVADITIVGAGSAGMTLAAAIKNSPILSSYKCKLVESTDIQNQMKDYQASPPKYYSNRAVSITPATIEYLQKIGAWRFVKQDRIQSFDYIHTYDGLTGSELQFDAPNLGTIIENYNLQSAAYERILELNDQQPANQLDIIDNTKVARITRDFASKWPIVHLSDGQAIKTRLLVGCDGGRSHVRKYARIPFRGWKYNRWGIVGTLRYKDTGFHSPTGWQRFLPTGPLAQLPMPNNWLSIVWSVPPELAMTLMSLSDESFVSMFNAASRLSQDELEYLYKIAQDEPKKLDDEIKWRLDLFNSKLTAKSAENYPPETEFLVPKSRARFPFKMSHVDDYVDERIALAGDAAHMTHPLAGQGMNMGQADVQCLVKTLEKSSERGLDIGTKFALDTYFSDRWPANSMMLGIVDKLHAIYGTSFPPVVWARSLGVDILNNLPFAKDLMVGQVSHRKL